MYNLRVLKRHIVPVTETETRETIMEKLTLNQRINLRGNLYRFGINPKMMLRSPISELVWMNRTLTGRTLTEVVAQPWQPIR